MKRTLLTLFFSLWLIISVNQEAKGQEDYHPYCGLIGVHTSYGKGKNNVKEYVKEAKKLGYDFLIFTDEDTEIDAQEWTELKQECRTLSDESFVAIPGIEITTPGYHCYSFLFDKWLDTGKHKNWFSRFWQIWLESPGYNILIKAGETALPSAQATLCGTVEAFAPGKDKFKNWLDYVRIRGVGIAATARAYSVEDLKKVGVKQYIWAANLKQEEMERVFSKHGPTRANGGYPISGFVSNGPIIKCYAALYNERVVWPNMNLTVRYGDKVRFHIKAKSKSPIREVEIYSGDILVASKTMNRSVVNMDIPIEYSLDMAYWCKVTDSSGRFAITSAIRIYGRDALYCWHCDDYMDSQISWDPPGKENHWVVHVFTYPEGWSGTVGGADDLPKDMWRTGHHFTGVLHCFEPLPGGIGTASAFLLGEKEKPNWKIEKGTYIGEDRMIGKSEYPNLQLNDAMYKFRWRMLRIDKAYYQQLFYFNYQDDVNDHYFLEYRWDGGNQGYRYRVWKHCEGMKEPILLGYEKPMLSQEEDKWYTMKIIKSEGNIKVYRDEELIIDCLDDSPLTSGHIQLGVAVGSAQFDDIEVWDTQGGNVLFRYDFNDGNQEGWLGNMEKEWITNPRERNGIIYTSKYCGIAYGEGENEHFKVKSYWYFQLPRDVDDYVLVWCEKEMLTKRKLNFARSGREPELILWRLVGHVSMSPEYYDLAKYYKWLTISSAKETLNQEVPDKDGLIFKKLAVEPYGHIVCWPNPHWSWAVYPITERLVTTGEKLSGRPHMTMGLSFPHQSLPRGEKISSNLLVCISNFADAKSNEFAGYIKENYLKPSWTIRVRGGKILRREFPIKVKAIGEKLELRFDSPVKLPAPVLVMVEGFTEEGARLIKDNENIPLIPFHGKVFFTFNKEKDEAKLLKINKIR